MVTGKGGSEEGAPGFTDRSASIRRALRVHGATLELAGLCGAERI